MPLIDKIVQMQASFWKKLNDELKTKRYVLYMFDSLTFKSVIFNKLASKKPTIIITRPQFYGNFSHYENCKILKKPSEIKTLKDFNGIIVTTIHTVSKFKNLFETFISEKQFNLIIGCDGPTINSSYLFMSKNLDTIFLDAFNNWRPKNIDKPFIFWDDNKFNQFPKPRYINNEFIYKLFNNKHPYWSKIIIKIIFNRQRPHGLHLNSALKTISSFIIENKIFLKNYIPKDFFNLEQFYDSLCLHVSIEKRKKLFKQILGNKFNILTTPENTILFSDLYFLAKEEVDVVKNIFNSKISRFKNPDDLTFFIQQEIKNINLLLKKEFVFNIKKQNVTFLEIDTIFIARIDNYETMKKIGASAWCITSSLHFFEQYTEGKEQFILYDFEYDPTDRKSMIGFTVNNRQITHAHFKNDSSCCFSAIYDKIKHIDNFKEVFGYELRQH